MAENEPQVPSYLRPIIADIKKWVKKELETRGIGTRYVDGGSVRNPIPAASIPDHDVIAKHTASGLTAGHVLTATGPTEFAFQEPTATAALTVEETDGAPSVASVSTIKVSAGTLTDNGDGTVTILTGSHAHYPQDDLSTQCDGSETVFSLAHAYEADSTEVSLNGLRQTPGEAYTETGSGTTITFVTAPESGDELLVAYIRAGAAGGGAGSGTSGDTAPADIYVATTGSDTTGDGTSGAPYATLAKALSILPTLLEVDHTIHVADGTYAEAIDLTGFVSKPGTLLKITGNTTTPASVTFTGTVSHRDPFYGTAYDCGCAASGALYAEVEGLRVNVTGDFGVLATGAAHLIVDRCTVAGTIAVDGIAARAGAMLELQGNITVSGFAAAGIRLMGKAHCYVTGAGTITITGAGAGSGGVSLGYQSQFIVNASGVHIAITNAQYGFVVTLNSVFQHYGASGSISATNTSTPSNSAGVLGTDVSTWSTNQALTLDHFTNSFSLNSITYAEAIGSRTITNCGAAAATQNSVAYLP